MQTELSPLAHQFDSLEQQHFAASLGMWMFLATEVMFFGGMFAGYAVYRTWYPEAFAAGSRQLDVMLGTVNTGILLLSSLCMALGVHAAQTNQQRRLIVCLGTTLLLGLVFLGIKGSEYVHKFHEHLVPGPNFHFSDSTGIPSGNVELFFSFYFAMTGCHALHMLVGAGILVTMMIRASRGAFSSRYYAPIEITGLYWHFVDIIWVFLFPLLYLIEVS